MKEEVFNQLLECILNSTSLIEAKYFALPVAYDVEDIGRERNYCYELYRHIRNTLPDLGYTFSAEIDKAGHELITPFCGRVTPDFLFHRPGNMGADDNHTIIEVKTFVGASISNENIGFLKDIRTINCMLNIENGYYRGILLVFGQATQEKKDSLRNEYVDRCNQEKIRLIFHDAPLTKAYMVS
ncbi:MAG TPA: hypothetical protein PLS50_08235 [Candidatus Dojkabacteria bacterium]|nr:hypothetical protein [Candidatus Dojkabacteria bacterium]